MTDLDVDAASGWLKSVRQVVSPNCDERPGGAEIDLVVIHGISLPPGQFGGSYVEQLFTNTLDAGEHPYFARIADTRVSSHVLVRRNGEIVQFVSFKQRAWHAGESCYGDRSGCNDFSIGIELEGTDEGPYEAVQYRRTALVIACLMRSWPQITVDRVVGHCDVAPGRKTDPGTAFEWERLRKLIHESCRERRALYAAVD